MSKPNTKLNEPLDDVSPTHSGFNNSAVVSFLVLSKHFNHIKLNRI